MKKTIVMAVLAVLLSAAVVSAILLYHQRSSLKESMETKEAELTKIQEKLEACLNKESGYAEKISDLERKLEREQEEKASLEARIQELKENKKKLAELRSRFKDLVADLKAQVRQKGVTIERLQDKLTVNVVDRILFDSGKVELRPEGKELLQRLVDVLKKTKQKGIQVVGHTDNVPINDSLRNKFPTNWELSTARATSVVRFLDRFLDPDRMEAVGCSFYDPVATNDTPEGRAKNRRVEIIIAPCLEPFGPGQ